MLLVGGPWLDASSNPDLKSAVIYGDIYFGVDEI